VDILGGEAAAEVSRRRRIRDRPRTEGLKVVEVVAKQLEVVEGAPARENVVDDVEDVIRLRVGPVLLQQLEFLIERPWQAEALSICLHKPQVYIDLSGWSPKYFPPQLVQYANTLLKHKMLFGSDFPLIKPDRWLADFEKADFRDEVRPLILRENAIRLLGLAL